MGTFCSSSRAPVHGEANKAIPFRLLHENGVFLMKQASVLFGCCMLEILSTYVFTSGQALETPQTMHSKTPNFYAARVSIEVVACGPLN